MSVTIDPEILEKAGDFNLDEITVQTITGEMVDFKAAFVEINIFESIYSNAVNGNIVIRDSGNFLNRYAISGQERIFFNVHTPGAENDDQINLKKFPARIYKVSDKIQTKEREQVYTLHFTSTEAVKNLRTRFSKALTGTTGEMVQTILTDKNYIGTDKKVFVEDTQNIHKIVFPYTRPFGAVSMLARRSESSTYNTPGFLFFETHRGYNFRSYESLTHIDKDPIPEQFLFSDMPYARDPNNPAMRDIVFDMSTIKEFRIMKTTDLLADTASGMLNSTLYTHDIHSKSFTKTEFKYLDNFYNRLHIDQNVFQTDYNTSFSPLYSETPETQDGKLTSDFTSSKIMVTPRATKLHSETKDDPRDYDNRTNIWLQNSLSNKLSTNAIQMEMTVHGNTYLAAGDVIRVNIQSNESVDANDERIYDEYFSGRWLITHCRHVINPREHETVIQCVKDTYFNALPVGEPIDTPQ
jgi:hypothetical protein